MQVATSSEPSARPSVGLCSTGWSGTIAAIYDGKHASRLELISQRRWEKLYAWLEDRVSADVHLKLFTYAPSGNYHTQFGNNFAINN